MPDKPTSVPTLADLFRRLPQDPGRHRTENRTGHYTYDEVTRPLSELVEGQRWWTERSR